MKFTAALLCAAMFITSSGTGVFASGLASGDELSAGTEYDVPVNELEDVSIADASADELSGISVEASSLEDEGLLISEPGEVSRDRADTATDCFEVDADGVLKVKSTYGSLSEYTERTKVRDFAIPAECKVIPSDSDLFLNNKNVDSVDFVKGGSGTLTINEYAFSGCSMKSFWAPNNYTVIKAGTFSNCDKLDNLTIKNVEEIGDSAFAGCTKLGTKDIFNEDNKSKVAKIGKYAFQQTGFTNLRIETLVVQPASGEKDEDCEVTIDTGAFADCESITSVTIPGNVFTVPDYCFQKCKNLTAISITGGKTEVGAFAFYNCTALTKIDKDKFNVASIGSNAFSGCSALEKVILPDTVKTIGSKAFAGCGKLVLIELWYKNPETQIADDIELAEDAFPTPIPAQATLRGFDGLVEEYAKDSNHKFKVYESLAGKYKITLSEKFKKSGVTMSTKFVDKDKNPAAAPGTKVQITIKNGGEETSKRIMRDSLYAAGVDKFTFVSGDKSSQVFEFVMPRADVIIDVDPGFYTDKNNIKGATVTHGITGNEFKWKDGDNKYIVDRPGFKGQITIDTTNSKGETAKIGNWMFKYASSNEKSVTVSSTGVITAIAQGDAEITVTYTGTHSFKKTFKVNVGQAAPIAQMGIIPELGKEGIVEEETEERVIDDVLYTDIPVVRFTQTEIEKSNLTFNLKLNVNATDDEDENYLVKADWKSGNTSIATLASASTINNKNTVTLKKGVLGETYIRAAYKLTAKETLYAYLIVRVVNIEPRLSMANVTVNIAKDDPDGGGTDMVLYPYKGYTFKTEELTLLKGPDANHTSAFSGVKVRWMSSEDGAAHINLIYNPTSTEPKPTKEKPIEYGGKEKIFICGYYDELPGQDKAEYFKVPLTKLTLVYSPLELKAKSAGTINLFYNASCYDPQSVEGHEEELPVKDNEEEDAYNERYIKATIGQIKVTNNIPSKTAVVDHAELWCKDKYKEYKDWLKDTRTNRPPFEYDDEDLFAENFTIEPDPLSDKDFIVRRSENALATEVVNGKDTPVTEGYLAVYFVGYTNPSVQSFKATNKTSAPGYVLSATKTNEHVLNTDGKFMFKIIDKKSKRVVINDTSCEELELTEDSLLIFSEVSMDGENITLSAIDDSRLGKYTAAIMVKRTNWNKAMKFKYSVGYVEKKPKAKFEKSPVVLNIAYPDLTSETILKLDQPNAELSVDDFFLVSGNAEEADNISIDVSDGDIESQKRIVVSFAGGTPKKGTYKFACIPSYSCGGGSAEGELKKITLSVRVVDKGPTFKLKIKSYLYNLTWGKDSVEAPKSVVTLGNLPAGVKYEDAEVDITGAEFVSAAKNPTAEQESIGEALELDKEYGVVYDKKTKKFYARVKFDTEKVKSSFNNKYFINGITINGTEVKENSVKVTVKGVLKTPSVSVKRSGSINTIDYTTGVKCVPQFKNLSSPVIKEVKVINMGKEGYRQESTVIEAVLDKDFETNSIVHLKAIHEDEERDTEIPNLNHKVRIVYTLENDKTLESQDITIKPKQLLPELKTGVSKLTFHQGAADTDENKHRSRSMTLTKATQLKTHITSVKLAESNPDILKQAFEVEYEESDIEKDFFENNYEGLKTSTLYAGDVIVTCKYPELLQAGLTYDLTLETEFDGQFWKRDEYGQIVTKKDKEGNVYNVLTTGSKVTIQVVVKK